MSWRCARAIVRPPGLGFERGLTQADLGPPDLGLALEQHAAYVDALRSLGVEVLELPPEPDFPDSTFVEDVAVVTWAGVILTNPGAPERCGEVELITGAIEALGAKILGRIEPPGTLDGGDVLEFPGYCLVGQSERTNEEGIRQMRKLLASNHYDVDSVDIRGIPGLLHLKTGMSHLGDNELISWPEATGFAPFAPPEIIISEEEKYAANAISINGHAIIAKGYPRLEQELCERGWPVVAINVSEFRKMDGGLSCLSLRFP